MPLGKAWIPPSLNSIYVLNGDAQKQKQYGKQNCQTNFKFQLQLLIVQLAQII